MWTTFKDCLDTILSNLDDFAVIIFILIVGNKLANLIYRFLANFMKTSLFTAQSVKLSLQVFIGVISFVHLVGDDIIKHASAGIAIGVGYAFQPYIISMFNGLMLHNDNLINSKKWLDVPQSGINGARVKSIGLFNTILEDHSGNNIIITNSSLTASAVTIHNEKPKHKSRPKSITKSVPGSEQGAVGLLRVEEEMAAGYMHRQIHHNAAFNP